MRRQCRREPLNTLIKGAGNLAVKDKNAQQNATSSQRHAHPRTGALHVRDGLPAGIGTYIINADHLFMLDNALHQGMISPNMLGFFGTDGHRPIIKIAARNEV